jgi:hypothetical protein
LSPRSRPEDPFALVPNFASRGRRASELLALQLGMSNSAAFDTEDELRLVLAQERRLPPDDDPHFHDLLLLYTLGRCEPRHLAELHACIPHHSVDIAPAGATRLVHRGLSLPSYYLDCLRGMLRGVDSLAVAHHLVHGSLLPDGTPVYGGLPSASTVREAAMDRRHGARGVTCRTSAAPDADYEGEHEIILDSTNRYEILQITQHGHVEVIEMVAYGKPWQGPVAPMRAADGWTRRSRPLGTNPGGIFTDPAGVDWYLKGGEPDPLKNEVLAARLYAMLRVTVPRVELVTRGGQTVLASRMLDVRPMSEAAGRIHGLNRGFVADAWLANWDVIGLDFDNLHVDANGHAVRVDTGGALLYRAQGAPKGAAFGPTVPEIVTLLDGTNPQSALAFGDLRREEIEEGIRDLQFVDDGEIRSLCLAHGPGDDQTRRELAGTLVARKNWLVAQLAAGLPLVHPRRDDAGRLVLQREPTRPSPPEHWRLPRSIVTVTPGGTVPGAHLGVRFEQWRHPPVTHRGWEQLSNATSLPFAEHAFRVRAGLRAASGILVVEDDGRIWLAEPSNHFGAAHSFPKGTQEAGLSLQANALKEVYEETGLHARITGWLGDYDRTTSTTRYFIGKRIGGTPSDMGWESQSVKLAPLADAWRLCDTPVDRRIIQDLIRRLARHPAS